MMTLSKMEMDLYQQVILEHNRKPKNFRVMDHPTHKGEGYNPLCGDHFWVYLHVNAEGIVEDVSFDGSGCAISKASASMMTTLVKGRRIAELQSVVNEFKNLITGQIEPEQVEKIGRLKIFAGVKNYPTRVKCAGLAWHTLEGALSEKVQVINTEEEESK